jgi:hypothetical protein
MANTDQSNEPYTEAETIARREATLKRMLATPHKPHKKLGSETKSAPRGS